MQTAKIKMLVLSLTGQCNYACRYCYASRHDNNIMTEHTAKMAVDIAAASNTPFILQFSGGEPLLNFKILQTTVAYVEQNNIPAVMQIQTNASLLTDEIAQYLYRHKVAIGVSLDGRPSVNDRLRITKDGRGASGDTVRGIEILKRNNIACGITCVVTSENVRELSGIVEFAYFLGNVRRIGFDLLRGQGRGSGLVPPKADDMAEAIRAVYERAEYLSKLIGYKIHFSQIEKAGRFLQDGCQDAFGHCAAMNGEAAFVDAKGDIYACASMVGYTDFYIGNVNSGLDELRVQQVKQHISRAMEFCRQCSSFKKCGGGCFARWYGSGILQPYISECKIKMVSVDMVNKM